MHIIKSEPNICNIKIYSIVNDKNKMGRLILAGYIQISEDKKVSVGHMKGLCSPHVVPGS